MSDRWILVDGVSKAVVAFAIGKPTPPAGQSTYPDPGNVGMGWVRQADGSFSNPAPPDSAPVIVLAKVDLFRRCSDSEADMITAALAEQSTKLQAIFSAALSYRSDAPEWPVLAQAATDLFGADRAAQLLAPST